MASRTITLSDRPPVKIDEGEWGIIARASDMDYDNQYEFQANRISKWWIAVRTNEGETKAIVYATYLYTSTWANESNVSAKHGVIVGDGSAEVPMADIVSAIKDVASRMAGCDHNGSDADKWTTLADECIADLPAEELS